MSPLIVPKCERKKRRGDDKELSQARRLTANAFLHLKWLYGIATRYAKHTAPFPAAVHIRRLVS